MPARFVAIDVETANPDLSSICQIGAVLVDGGVVADRWLTYVNPEAGFDPWNVAIHGITPERVEHEPTLPGVVGALATFVGACVVVSHTAFDRVALSRAHARYDLTSPDWRWIDTARVSRRAWPQFARAGYGLANVARHCGISYRAHDAGEDARAAAEVLLAAIAHSGMDVDAWLTRARQPLGGTGGGKHLRIEGNPDGPLDGEVVVFTGSLTLPRARVAERAARAGCDVRDSVTTKTTMLVVGQQDLMKLGGYDKSRKQRRAEELISAGADIKILGEEDFFRLVEDAQV
jgi:DNA polymerase-3 subunit epsilon